MRSLVGWLSFGIVLVFVINVESEVSLGNYHHVIHEHGYGYPPPILQRMVPVPAIGYGSVVPQVIVRGVETPNNNVYEENLRRQEYEYNRGQTGNEYEENPGYPDQYNSDESDESDESDQKKDSGEEDEPSNEHEGGEESSEASEEDSNEEKEEEEEGYQEHYEEGYYGRKTYRNNKLQITPRKPSNKIRNPLLQKNSTIADQLNQRKKNNKSKKKKPSEIPEEIQAEETINSQRSNATHESIESHKQIYQLKSVGSSNVNQFVATPIADLILRLSISLARPIGHGNGTATYLNVPIRLSNTGTEENNSTASNESPNNKVKIELQKPNSILVKSRDDPGKVVTVPIKADVLDIDDDEQDEEDTDQLSA